MVQTNRVGAVGRTGSEIGLPGSDQSRVDGAMLRLTVPVPDVGGVASLVFHDHQGSVKVAAWTGKEYARLAVWPKKPG